MIITNPFTSQTLVVNGWTDAARKASAAARRIGSGARKETGRAFGALGEVIGRTKANVKESGRASRFKKSTNSLRRSKTSNTKAWKAMKKGENPLSAHLGVAHKSKKAASKLKDRARIRRLRSATQTSEKYRKFGERHAGKMAAGVGTGLAGGTLID
jgi:hypothetical protein